MQISGQSSPAIGEEASPPKAPFLLTATDLATLAQTDEEFRPHTWSDLKLMIADCDYARVKRFPSQLRRYIDWSNAIKDDPRYGSSTAYIKKEVVRWTDKDLQALASNVPLADDDDFQVLLTEWPYALEPGVSHFVVWLKHFLDVGEDGDLTKESRELVDAFVDRWFRRRIECRTLEAGEGLEALHNRQRCDLAIWGKAKKMYNTVTGVEHFHVWALGLLMAQSHLYEPLTEDNTFRFLDLHPGQKNSPIVCTLRVARLEHEHEHELGDYNQPDFEALSYVWGSPIITHRILLDGRSYGVRENLWNFLQYRRDMKHVCTLWIDALCIDQNNMVERGQQVKLMQRIYRGARTVTVWLGCKDERHTRAMKTIRQSILLGVNAVPQHSDDVDCIFRWARSAYFTRTWVRQEFMLARDLVVMYGDVIASWQVVRNFCLELVYMVSQPSSEISGSWLDWEHTPAFHMVQYRYRQANTQLKLLDLLVDNQETQCLERIDKVFAMVSMASDCQGDRCIPVDYNRKLWQVLLDVMLHAQLSPKHTLRYAQFIAQLLSIAGTSLESTELFLMMRRADFQAVSKLRTFPSVVYRTGEILGPIISGTGSNFHGLTNVQCESMIRALRQIKWDVVENAAELLHVPLPRKSKHCVDNAKANGPSCVVASFGNLRKRKTALAFCTSPAQAGDHIYQFPGHEVALVFNKDQAIEIGKHKALFVAADIGVARKDLYTSKLLSYQVLQNESELQSGTSRTLLSLTPTQLFSLIAASPTSD